MNPDDIPPDPWRSYKPPTPPPRPPLKGFALFVAGLPFVVLFWIVAGILRTLLA